MYLLLFVAIFVFVVSLWMLVCRHNFTKVIRMFDDGNVSVCGLRGRGKDMLMANVAVARDIPYISNCNYGGKWIPLNPSELDCNNDYKNFCSGDVNYYEYPFEDGTDVYISDAGVYYPSQYCNKLNNEFSHIPTFMALSRHFGECNVHFNAQNLNRVWDKLREQSDCYIMANKCTVLFGGFLVVQSITVYDRYESAVSRVPVFPLKRPLLNRDRKQLYEIEESRYLISHGNVKKMTLVYHNRSKYNTRIFKEMLKDGKKNV